MGASNVDRGWAWVVLLCSFLIHTMTYGLAWSTGVYNVIFLETFGQPKSVTAWAGSIPTAMLYAIGPIASMLTNKYGARAMIIVGGLILSLGLCLSYFATSLYVLFFTFGVVTGCGLGLIYIPTVTAVPSYFKKKLSIATGIAASGVGVGNFLYPTLIRWLVNKYDWKQSFLILGAISLNICVLGALIRPVKMGELSKNRPILDLTPFKKKGYIMLCLNVFLYCCGISSMYIHLAAHGEFVGIDGDMSAILISGLGISNIFGRLIYGFIGHHPRLNPVLLYSVSFFLSGVCICVVPVMHSYAGLMTCAVLFGLFSSCFGTLLVLILVQLLGLQRFANGFGCLLIFMAAGQLVGASLTGAMFDITQTYALAFIIGGIFCIFSALVMIQPYCYSKNNESESDIVTEIPAENTRFINGDSL